jgi:carbonic anhydrase
MGDPPDSYEQVFIKNRQWAAERAQEPGFFERLAAGQSPEFLYIGCSDSRVPANTIMGIEPGEVFVHRNVANMVVNTDFNAQTAIEYAITVLGVKHVLVCGHYGCGGVAAAMESKDRGLLNNWLREIRDVYRLHHEELNAIPDEQARNRRLVELNVREQCVHVMKTAAWQKSYLKHKLPIVHGLVFDLSDGLLLDLELDNEAVLADIRRIYRLDIGDL